MTKVPFIHENPLKEGRMARSAGLNILDNPHKETGLGAHPNSYVLWKEGWHDRNDELLKEYQETKPE